MITIFGEQQQANPYPSSFAVSVLLHAAMFSLLTLHILEKDRIIETFPSDRYSLRLVDFHSTEPQAQPVSGGISYPGLRSPHKSASKRATAQAATGGHASGPSSMTRETAQRMPAPQTLIQPDLPRDVVMPSKPPVPLVVLWSPEKTVPKKVVPPQPDRAAIAVVRPSLDTPIPEENLAELRISPTSFVTATPIAAPPSTTSPVVVHGPEEVKKVPQTTSKQPEPFTPARVVSLSDIRVAEGKVAIPMANQTSPKQSAGALIPGQLKAQAHGGVNASASKSTNNGSDTGALEHGSGLDGKTIKTGKGNSLHVKAELADGAGRESGAASAINSGDKPGQPANASAQPAGQGGTAGNLSQGSGSGTSSGNGISTVHISMPRDGQFGVVVVGSSVADKYPETAELWSGRMGSTVYLRVGLPKSWILQYTLPRLAEAVAGGSHLDAPWPYEIVRPNIDPGDSDADAIILHGYVNQDGRFEKLEVVFPTTLVQTPMVLNVLNQWQFRPAKQNGILAAVEVLLIIPDQSE